MKNLFYILVLAVAFTSCRSSKPKVESVKTVLDSTVTKVTHEIKYDTIIIPGDTVKISVPYASLTDKPIISTSQSGRVKGAVSKVNGNIEVECYVDELIKIIEIQNTTIETLTKRLETLDTTITETEYKTPWYSKILAGIGVTALLLLVIKFLKPF